MQKCAFVFVAFLFITMSLNGQDKKVKFTYEINGASFNGSVRLMGVDETVIDNRNAQVKLRPGASWILGCPENAEYCGMMLAFKDLKLGQPNHEGRIYYADYANLNGMQVDTRGSEFKYLGQGNDQAIISFGVMEIKSGSIGFKLKINDGSSTVSVNKNGSDVFFTQNYTMKETSVAPVVTAAPKPSSNTNNNPSSNQTSGSSNSNAGNPKSTRTQPLLTDDEYWKRAQLGGTIEYYREYLDNYPEGEKKTWALAKIDSLEWDNVNKFRRSDNPTVDKIAKYYTYLETKEDNKEKTYQIIDSLNWEKAEASGNYEIYLKELIDLKEKFPTLQTPFVGDEALALRFGKICDGRNCTIKFENVIGEIEASNFKGDEVNIKKIENNEVFIEIGNPKSKYVLSFEDKLGRVATFILGLEDYFSLDYAFKKNNKKIEISALEGGVSPYFLQVKSEGLIIKQIALGAGPEANVELDGIDELPNEIQLYLTDADKKIEKYLETISLEETKGFVGSQLFFLLVAVAGFSVVGLIFLFMFRQNKKKAAEWDY